MPFPGPACPLSRDFFETTSRPIQPPPHNRTVGPVLAAVGIILCGDFVRFLIINSEIF